MNTTRWQIFCNSILFTASLALAQNQEHYLPVGFQNPILKSGQYIFSASFNNSNQKSTQESNIYEYGKHYFNALGYLGVTDRITLSTFLTLSPEQTVSQSRGNYESRDRENFNATTSLNLSYRLHSGFELFSAFGYNRATIEYGDRTYLTLAPVGFDPNTGEVIYRETRISQPALPAVRRSGTGFSMGLTFVGNLWH